MDYHLSLIKDYPDVKPEILKGYKEPDTELIVNDTGDHQYLRPIDISRVIPKPPPPHEIDGFGLPAKEQYFRKPQMPDKLKRLIKKKSFIQEIHEELEEEQSYYHEEIEWIRDQWRRLFDGYWFYNNGVPTYIDGWHYVYCSYWHIDIGLPDYRARDRKFFLFARFCYTDTSIFNNYDDKGWAVGDDMTDIGVRICFGFNYPKYRREGATYKAECLLYFMLIIHKNAKAGIQSMDEKQAEVAFQDHLIAPWKKLPFFFKPEYEGSDNPKTKLSLQATARKVSGKTGAFISGQDSLESSILFASTADRGFFDGDKLIASHDDEEGKTILENVVERWRVKKKCHIQGKNIIGLNVSTSTVAEQSKKGGRNYKILCEQSYYHQRNKNGRTTSGKYNLFIPAYDGYEGFIDRYGNSIIDEPTDEQYEFMKENQANPDAIIQRIGAKEFLMNERNDYLIRGDQEGYSEACRLDPITFKECFYDAAKDSGFNLIILNQRTEELRVDPTAVTVGDLHWLNGKFSENPFVYFKANPSGKFRMSQILDESKTNKIIKENGHWRPLYLDKYMAGMDPFKFQETEGSKKSDGAGAVFWNRDKQIDPDGLDVSQWQSNRIVCTYLERVLKTADYADDMLKMCLYFGAMANPEINIPLIWDKFDEWGYNGFLYYDVNPDGTTKKTPGFHKNEPTQQAIMAAVMNYIELHGRRDRHINFLEQCINIESYKELKFYDLIVACGAAMTPSENLFSKLNRYASNPEAEGEPEDVVNLEDYFPTYPVI